MLWGTWPFCWLLPDLSTGCCGEHGHSAGYGLTFLLGVVGNMAIVLAMVLDKVSGCVVSRKHVLGFCIIYRVYQNTGPTLFP